MSEKKITFLTYAESQVGLGHWFRTQALEDEAKSRGHATHFLTNRMLFRQMYFQIRNENVDDFYNCLHQIKPHVLIVDVQGHIPDYMHEIARKFNVKIVILNGVGRVDENHADLVIVQGFNNGNQNKNTVSGPEYVILRSKLNQVPAMHSGNAWFVWGGANDKMSLLEAFNQFDDREAILAVHKEFINPSTYNKIVNTQPNSLHLICQVTGDAMLPIMANSKRACIAMGMTAWELAYFGTPTYVFSATPGHLKFAQDMDAAGLLMAYPQVGLPDIGKMKEFLDRPFEVNLSNKPDLLGAKRVMDLIESL